ncbi:MAG TPA: O-antigen ligase family protein [Bryobacteraceae bacterium]|nr:O-antigen ligase family protein [Bryobacteraceae bacterium]
MILGLALVFLRFSMLHQVLEAKTGVNFRLLYVFGIPALLGVALSGGFNRAFRGRPAYYWSAFLLWIAICVPFSYWRAASFGCFSSYLRTNLAMLFIIAGLTVTWPECRRLMTAIALGGVVNLWTAQMFQNDGTVARFGGGVGTVANSNDFAAHMLLVLSFLLWIALGARSTILRIIALAGVAFGVLTIVRTGSRGALVGLIVAILFFLWRGTIGQRIGLLVAAPVAVLTILSLAPADTLQRITSFSSGNEEALASRSEREYLFETSLKYTFEFPIFGVGPEQFPAYEGANNIRPGFTHGRWQGTHNTFTQISSECGIPGLVFFVGGIVSTLVLLNATYLEARRRPNCADIRNAAFCVMMGYTAFIAAIAFLNFGYFFYFPAMGGLAICISCAAQEEFRSRAAARPIPGLMRA